VLETCETCPHDFYERICEHFGYCLNLQRLVIASSDCEQEEGA